MINDVFIVLRTAGERTTELAHRSLEPQVPKCRIVLIREVPFARAVRRTIELGLERQCQWTLAIDADVIVRPKAIATLVACAQKADRHVFEFEGWMYDKLFQGPRYVGMHLYRTSLLDRALEFARSENIVHRPEFHVIESMREVGYPHERFRVTLGLHDFEQTYRDLYRKGFVHAQKHSEAMSFLRPMWDRLARIDRDFLAVRIGMEAGEKAGGIARTDVREFDSSIDDELRRYDLMEKEPLSQSLDIESMMQQLTNAPEFEAWKDDGFGTHRNIVLSNMASRLLRSVPWPVRRAARKVLGLPVPDESK